MSFEISRRKSIQTLGLAALAYSLPQLAQSNASDQANDPGISEWLDRLYQNASRLRAREISSLQWQETMDVIYADVPLDQLRQRLEFPSLQRQILDRISPERSELFQLVQLPGSGGTTADGREPHRMLLTKVAYIKKGRSVPPHGHSNMTSAFLCISGEFAVKLYDKVEEREDHLVLRQTVDEDSAGAGTWSSISDYRDNVHWLTAKTDDCFLFTSKLIGVEVGRELNGRINVDVKRAVELGSQTLRAPKITSKQAAEIY